MLSKYKCVVEEDGVQFDFYCMADDEEHAREQAINGYPEGRIPVVLKAESVVHFGQLRAALQVLTEKFPGMETGEDVNGGDLVQAVGEMWTTLKEAAWSDWGQLPAPRQTEELLSIATTALRDKYVGAGDEDLCGVSGDGLGTLLRDLVAYQRGQGIDDEGGWDCGVTTDIPVSTGLVGNINPFTMATAESDRVIERLAEAQRKANDIRVGMKERLVAMKEAGLTYAEVLDVFGERRIESPYIRAAQRKSDDGTVEVDDTAIVSESGDGDAYISAWLWVSDDEADDCTISAAIERMLGFVTPLVQGVDAEYVAWAEDLLANHAENINDIHNAEPVNTLATPIRWMCKDGTTISFLPSEALDCLRKQAAITKFANEDDAPVVVEFIQHYGSKLDRILTNIPIGTLAD